MGNGNVTISMALAEHQLSSLGITQPTPDQIRAAMVGGTVVGPDGKATNLEGVLTMRAQGMGWGRIAQAQGVKLGQVMSALKSAHARAPGTGGTLPTEHATFKGRHDFQGTDHDARSATTAGGTSRGVTTAAGSATQNRKIEADNRAAASGSSTNASGAPSGRGIVTAAGTGAAGVRVGESGDRSGSHAATTASGSTLGRGITTAGSSGGNTAAASSGIVRADGSGAGSARSGNGFGHR